MTKTLCFLQVFVVLIGVVWPETAAALVMRVSLSAELDEVEAPVFPEKPLKIIVPRHTVITHAYLGNRVQYTVTPESSQVVLIDVVDHARPTTLSLSLRDGRHITVQLRLADDSEHSTSRLEFFEPPTRSVSQTIPATPSPPPTLLATPRENPPALATSTSETVRPDSLHQSHRVYISLHGVLGRAKLNDVQSQSFWAPQAGVGFRVAYGFSSRITLDASMDYQGTNATSLQDGDGWIREEAGRIMAAGRFHAASTRWCPYAQVALGVRMTRRVLALNQGDMEDYRAGAILGLGGGVLFAMPSVFIGLHAAHVAPITGDDSTHGFEFGLSAGSHWEM